MELRTKIVAGVIRSLKLPPRFRLKMVKEDPVRLELSLTPSYGKNPVIVGIVESLDLVARRDREGKMPRDLQETAYLVRVDHRLLRLEYQAQTLVAGGAGTGVTAVQATAQFVDDDAIATYYFAAGDETRSVFTSRQNPPTSNAARARDTAATSDTAEITPYEAFSGPLGSILQLMPKTSIEIQSSVSLFNELGTASSATINLAAGKPVGDHKFIDTIINVVGVTTGYSMDIPIRIIRKN